MYKDLVALAPMRVHPFHYGHALYLHQLSVCFGAVYILLNKEYSVDNDPYPFSMRREWVLRYVNQVNLTNVFVPMRFDGLSTDEEYPIYAEDRQFVVLTTNVTHKRYSDIGFAVFNHESDRLPVPDDLPTYLYEFLNRSSMGTMIRERLRAGVSCDEYLPVHVRGEAVLYIGSLK